MAANTEKLNGRGAAQGTSDRPGENGHGIRRPRWSGYTAFVLSGGGARGAIQVGALRALLEHGEHPDVVVGTSIGAWNGAWLARTPTLEGVEALAEVWRGLTPARVLLGREPYGNPPPRTTAHILQLAAVRRLTQGQSSLYGDAGLRLLVTRLMGDARFEDLALPLRVIAANLSDGTRTVFSSGVLAPALLASSAIPGVFPPVRLGANVYVDGGALDNFGLDLALQLGARRLFIVDVATDLTSLSAYWSGEPGPRPDRVRASHPHALAVLERTTQAMSAYHLDLALKRLPRGIEVHLIRPATPGGGGVLDFGRGAEWIAHADAFTRAYLRTALPARAAASVESSSSTARAAGAGMLAGAGSRG